MAKKSTAILVGIALALSLGVAIIELGPRRQQQALIEAQKRLFDVETDDITNLTLTANNDTFQLARADNTWRLQQPIQTEAEDLAVNNLLTAIASLESQTKLTEKPTNLAEFGLDASAQTIAFATSAGDRHSLKLGNDTFDSAGTYVQIDDGNVAIVSAAAKDGLQPALFDLRAKSLMATSQSDIQSLTIATPTGESTPEIELVADGNQWKISQPRALIADSSTVSTLFSQLTFLQATDILDTPNSDLSIYGLDEPEVTFLAELKSGEPPVNLIIGRSEDGNLYVQSSHLTAITEGSDPIAAIAPTSLDSIPTDLFALRDKSLGDIVPTLIGKVEIDSPDAELKRTLTLVETDSTDTSEALWAVSDQSNRQVSLDAIFEPITTARATAFIEASAPDARALDQPKFTLKLFPNEGVERESLELTFATEGDRLLVRSSDRADILVLAPELLAGLETAIVALKPSNNQKSDDQS
ncbi:MAG: DUF4340 domain-containing protein [Cyanobacteria bacterium J06642_2]